MKLIDIVIIGGGPAGLAAAVSAKENGIDSILILERDGELGGILNQCIHNGFGLHTFKEELTGPEYAARFADKVQDHNIPYMLNTMVTNISADKIITIMNSHEGLFQIKAKAIILAMGCRERSRGALNIPGHRPAGIYSAGTAQLLVNMKGMLPGREVVILGSGDIGLIMARRMTLEGAHVKLVAEIMPYSGGLKRNIVQCLDDYDIPLKLSHTVVDVKGKERLTSVIIAQVDKNFRPIKDTEQEYTCDTLLLSCGLIPENELSLGMGVKLEAITNGPTVNESLETNIAGVFACGNVLHVHDLVDFVSEEATIAGKNAANYVKNADNDIKNATNGINNINNDIKNTDNDAKDANNDAKDAKISQAQGYDIPLISTDGVRYTVPHTINAQRIEKDIIVRFRVGMVKQGCYASVYFDDKRVIHKKKLVVAPGEMEKVKLTKKLLLEYPEVKQIIFKLEDV